MRLSLSVIELYPPDNWLHFIYSVQKKTPTDSFFHISMNDGKNCSEYTQGRVVSENVEIRYSLRPMT